MSSWVKWYLISVKHTTIFIIAHNEKERDEQVAILKAKYPEEDIDIRIDRHTMSYGPIR